MKKQLSRIFLALCLFITLSVVLTGVSATEETPITDGSNGFVLQNAVTYHVTTNTTVRNLRVAGNSTVTIIIDPGVTLTSVGDSGTPGIGGQAGIYLPEGSTLILKGGGTLIASGGRGGNGTDGSRGTLWHRYETPDSVIDFFKGISDVDYIGGTGGKGGIGAGGGGAGIGTNGANGALPGDRLGQGCGFDFEGGKNGFSYTTGSSGVTGGSSANSGTMYNYGVNLRITPGSGGSGGTTADEGSKSTIKHAYKVDFGLLGEWDVLETFICSGEGGGGGQPGNSGNAIGAGGGGGGSGHNGAGGGGQCSRNFVFGVRTMSYIRTSRASDGSAGSYGSSGNYYVYSKGITYNGSPSININTSSVGATVTQLSYLTVDVNLDDAPYASEQVYLWNDVSGKTVMNKIDTGKYDVFVKLDSAVTYSIYVDNVISGYKIMPNAVTPATVTVEYYTASVEILNGGNPWPGQQALLAGDGKIQPLFYCTEGTYQEKYTTIIPVLDTTKYRLRVNGADEDNYIKIDDLNQRSTKAEFINVTVTINLNGEASVSDVFSVMLKKDGKTVYVMNRDAENNRFTATGVQKGTYNLFVYGTSSSADTGKTVSLDTPSYTFDYYAVHFRKNMDDTTTDCQVQYRAKDDTITLAGAPYTAGYTFAGWKTDAEGTADYVPGIATEETFVYAAWLVPEVSLGTSVRCDENGSVKGDGEYFILPNLSVQGYPKSTPVIHTFTVTLENIKEAGNLGDITETESELTIEGKTWKRSTLTYDKETATGIIVYQMKSANDALTLSELQSFLRSKVYKLKDDTADGSIKIMTYGSTNN